MIPLVYGCSEETSLTLGLISQLNIDRTGKYEKVLPKQKIKNPIQNLRFLLNFGVPFQRIKSDLKKITLDTVIKDFNIEKALVFAQKDGDLHRMQKEHFEILFDEAHRFEKSFRPFKGLVSGTGESSHYGIGISLHPTLGIPILPASSWEGMIRAWFIKLLFDNSEEKALADPDFLWMFGSTDQRGNLIFFDALPELHQKSLAVELCNPQMTHWYEQNEKVKTFYHLNPVPVQYLFVKNTTWIFRAGYEGKKWCCKGAFLKISTDPIHILNEQLPYIFRYLGVGAKTSKGFGISA